MAEGAVVTGAGGAGGGVGRHFCGGVWCWVRGLVVSLNVVVWYLLVIFSRGLWKLYGEWIGLWITYRFVK